MENKLTITKKAAAGLALIMLAVMYIVIPAAVSFFLLLAK